MVLKTQNGQLYDNLGSPEIRADALVLVASWHLAMNWQAECAVHPDSVAFFVSSGVLLNKARGAWVFIDGLQDVSSDRADGTLDRTCPFRCYQGQLIDILATLKPPPFRVKN